MTLYGNWEEVVAACGMRAMAIRASGNMATAEKRNHHDIVTAADTELESEILSPYVRRVYPDDGFVGEEGAEGDSRSGFRWYFDPIDGTANFRDGIPFWAVSAGRGDAEGVSTEGITYIPEFDESFWARRGEGAFDDRGNRLAVNRLKEPKQSVIAIGPRSEHRAIYGALSPRFRNVLALGSCVYEAMLVASGKLGGYIHTGATQFDVAAATVICEEAGCVVTGANLNRVDLRAKTIPFVVAASVAIHEEILAGYSSCGF